MRKQPAKAPAVPDKTMGRKGFFGDENFRVSYTPSSAGRYDIYLFGEIEDTDQFTDAIEALNGATEQDLIMIHLSTNGGSMDATDTFLAAMGDTKATVAVSATGGVHSAGTLILLAAESFRLSENFNCLVHNGGWGVYGKSSDAKAQATFTANYMERTARAAYEGFMTPGEITAMIDGKDFWMDGTEFMERIQARAVYFGEELVDTAEAEA